MRPKYGDMAVLPGVQGGGGDLKVMVIAPYNIRAGFTDALDWSWAVIVDGDTPFDGAIRGPGFLGPIVNGEAEWLDDGA